MNVWLLMCAIGALTYSIRASLIVSSGRFRLPDAFQRGLRYVPSAVLTALILPQFLVFEGDLSIDPSNPRLLAGIVAGVVAAWTKSMVATIATGMIALWLLQYFFGG